MSDQIIQTVADLPEPRFPKLNPRTTKVSYDAKGDILILLFETGKLATSVDQGEFWLRMDPITGNVHGVEIENFEAAFLKRHPNLAVGWDENKRTLRRRRSRPSNEPLIQAILDSLGRSGLEPAGQGSRTPQ